MPANTSRTEIVSQILSIVKGYGYHGAKETIITSDVYLSSSELREYLIALTVHGLLIYEPIMRRYDIAEKGLRFLELYNKLGDMLKEEEQEDQKLKI